MEFADDLAGDVFNALYQHNPTLGAESNSKYSQTIRAALASPQFQHLRMQTRDSVHWSATAAALITSTLAKELNFRNEEEPPIVCGFPGEPSENEPQSGGNEEEQSEPQSGEGQQSSKKFDENAEDSDDSAEDDSENGNGGKEEGDPASNDGSEESDKDENDDNGESGEEQSEETDTDGNDADNNEDKSGEEDSDNDSDGSEESDGENDKPNEQSDPTPEPIGEPSKDITDALNKAAKEVEQLMGGIRAGTSESMLGSKGDSELAELYTALGNNAELSRLLQMIGRMQISQHFLNGVSYAQTETPVAITQGRDIRNVLPQDMGLLLGNTEEFNVFAAKYNNSELLQRQLKAETKSGKGPMIVCLDESGSMDGEKSTWANSITIAMYLQCLKDRRQFALVKFASNSKIWPIPNSLTRMDIDFLKSISNHGYLGGGTNFQSAWNDATKFIRSNPSWKQADIVFVTDGMGNYNADQFRKDKDQLKVRLISFFIDPDDYISRYAQYGNSYSNVITDFVDLNEAFTHIVDLSERGERQAFELIRKKNVNGKFSVQNGKLVETTFKKEEEEELTF
jgi:hypothetical protein